MWKRARKINVPKFFNVQRKNHVFLFLKDQACKLFFTSDDKKRFSISGWGPESKTSDLWPSWQKSSKISKLSLPVSFNSQMKTFFPTTASMFGDPSWNLVFVHSNLTMSSWTKLGFLTSGFTKVLMEIGSFLELKIQCEIKNYTLVLIEFTHILSFNKAVVDWFTTTIYLI